MLDGLEFKNDMCSCHIIKLDIDISRRIQNDRHEGRKNAIRIETEKE